MPALSLANDGRRLDLLLPLVILTTVVPCVYLAVPVFLSTQPTTVHSPALYYASTHTFINMEIKRKTEGFTTELPPAHTQHSPDSVVCATARVYRLLDIPQQPHTHTQTERYSPRRIDTVELYC